ncbi:hypothetical protein OQA88_1848 [Cercophora sp. LCS_1]
MVGGGAGLGRGRGWASCWAIAPRNTPNHKLDFTTDPISALSLVANIFGVITFASGVVKIAAQIHQSAANDQVDTLQQSADALKREIELVQRAPLLGEHLEHQGDHDFAVLAKSGIEIGLKVSKLLQDVRGTDKGKNVAWKTFRQTFKTVWNKSEIDSLGAELSQFQGHLQRHAVLLIKEKLDKQSAKLEDVLKSLDSHALSHLSTSTFLRE